MTIAPIPLPELWTLKVIAARLGIGIKRLNVVLERTAGEHPLPVHWDRVREDWVVDGDAMATWETEERALRPSYEVAIASGLVRGRKAS